MPKKIDYSIITVTADIHADGDIYVLDKKGSMRYIGKLGESTFGVVPDPYYKKIKEIAKTNEKSRAELIEYFSHDIHFKDEAQRKAAVKMYIDYFNNLE